MAEKCQNDEVSPDVHTLLSREVVVRYPLRQHCCLIPHLTQRGIEFGRLSDILNEARSIRKLGTFGVPSGYRHEVVTGTHNSVKQVLNSVKYTKFS